MSTKPLPPTICLAEPQPGDFCCVPIAGLGGVVIETGEFLTELLEGQPAALRAYDHAEVYVGQPDADGPYGYTYSAYPGNGKHGAAGKRALPCPPAQLPGSLWSSGIIDLTAGQRAGVAAWCEAHPAVPYSWLDYGAIGLHAMHIPVPGLRHYISGTSHMICSQYTDAAYQAGGVHLFQDSRWNGYVTPADLASMLMATAHLAVPGAA